LFLNQENGDRLVLMSVRFWGRLMASVAAGWGSIPDLSDLSKGAE